jgi:hypothetical protein
MKQPRRIAGWLAKATIVTMVVVAGGCVDPLFPETEDRTPFDRYDAVRNREEPASVSDEHGRRKPNLRGRLSRR